MVRAELEKKIKKIKKAAGKMRSFDSVRAGNRAGDLSLASRAPYPPSLDLAGTKSSSTVQFDWFNSIYSYFAAPFLACYLSSFIV